MGERVGCASFESWCMNKDPFVFSQVVKDNIHTTYGIVHLRVNTKYGMIYVKDSLLLVNLA